MAARPTLPAQIYALDLGPSARCPVLCLDGWAYRPFSPADSPVDISTRTAQRGRVSTLVLLWPGLPATGSLRRPIADYHAFLRIGCLLPWSVAGSALFFDHSFASSGRINADTVEVESVAKFSEPMDGFATYRKLTLSLT